VTNGTAVRILIEIDERAAEPPRDAASTAASATDDADEPIAAGPGPGAPPETSDEPAEDGGGPSAALLDEIAAAEQLSPEGDTAEATDAGAGPPDDGRG
jgi:hypothetical protein